jgi:hypothetical protein
MPSQRFRRLASAAALAAALALATPAHAASPPPWLDPARLAQRTLQWLSTLWNAGPRTPAVREKAGHGIDPDGSSASEAGAGVDPNGSSASTDRGAGVDPDGSSTSTTTCTGDCERGAGVDPNG